MENPFKNPDAFVNTVHKIEGVKSQQSSTAALKPKVELNKWEQNVLPNIERLGLSNELDYQSTKFLKAAYTGAYWKAISNKEFASSNPTVVASLKKVQNNSVALAQELAKENPNMDLISKYYSDAHHEFEKVNSGLTTGAFKLDPMTGKLLNEKQARLSSQEVEVFDDNSTSARVKKTPGMSFSSMFGPLMSTNLELVNDTPTYSRLQGMRKYQQSNLRQLTNSYVTSWMDSAFTNMQENNPKKQEYNEAVYNMSLSALKHVAKYGTASSDEKSSSHKAMAGNFLKNIQKLNPIDQLTYLSKYRQQIKEITSNLGYYGSSKIYDEFKDRYGKTDAFYPYSDNPSKFLDGMEKIEKYRDNYNQFKTEFENIKIKSLNTAYQKRTTDPNLSQIELYGLNEAGKSQLLATMFNSAVNDKGDLISFDKFKQEFKSTLLLSPEYRKMNIRPSDLSKILLKDYASDADVDAKLKEHYYNIAKGYKRSMDNLNGKALYSESMLTMGLGDYSRKAVGFSSVNLKTNEYGSLISGDSPKQQNVQTLWNVLKNQDGSFGKPGTAIISPTTSDLKSISSSELNDLAKNSNAAMREFLKGNPQDVQMKFFKYSNVPGYSTYVFTNNETKKSVTAFVSQNALGLKGVKEPLYMQSSAESVADWNFQLRGKKEFAERKDKDGLTVLIKKPELVFNSKKNTLQLQYSFLNNAGNYVNDTYDLPANIPIGKASEIVDHYLNSIIK